MSLHDKVLHDLHQRVKDAAKYKKGDPVLFISVRGELLPMVVEEVVENAYWDGHAYKLLSVTHPNVGTMFAHERWVRPMLRTRHELRQTMRII